MIFRLQIRTLCKLCFVFALISTSAFAQSKPAPALTEVDLLRPQTDRSAPLLKNSDDLEGNSESVFVSPKSAWNPYPKGKQETAYDNPRPLWSRILLWLPNRVADLLDIFKLDVGVGPSFGAVVRVSKYGQVGIREMSPLSVRAGLMGRQSPLMIERSNEMGFGPGFLESKDRHVCSAEIGVGIDPVIAGIYAGVCFDEFFDFTAGIFGYDFKEDDF
jgi:hypothetical protein